MKGFEVNEKERAFVRSKLPPELIATVDNAEAAMNVKVDETITTFKTTIQEKLTEFIERDFTVELQEKLKAEQETLVKSLSESAKDVSEKINEINAAVETAAAADPSLKKALDELNTAQINLDSELQQTRDRVAAIGTTAAKLTKSAASKILTGIF